MNNRSMVGGIVLIILGCLLLVGKFVFDIEIGFRAEDFWALIVLGIGLAFEFSFFMSGKKPGVLVPGGILTVLGCLFLFEVSTNWRLSEYTWPIYIFSVAVGLFQLYLFGGRQKGLLIPVGILTAVAVTSTSAMVFEGLSSVLDFGLVVPIVLIIAGILIFTGKNRNNKI